MMSFPTTLASVTTNPTRPSPVKLIGSKLKTESKARPTNAAESKPPAGLLDSMSVIESMDCPAPMLMVK